MKTFLPRLLFVMFLAGSLQIAKAQCTVSDIIIQNVVPATTQTPGTCTVKFDVSFTIENNNGNKFIFFHVWTQSQYPNYFDCVNGVPSGNGAIRSPRAADLAGSFINFGINNNGPVPQILSTYLPDASVPMTTADSISREIIGGDTAVFILYGVTTTLPVPCGSQTVLIADLWSSQSASAQVAHCVTCGIRYAAGYLTASGLVNCAALMYNATLTNLSAVPLTGFFRVYVDVNGDNYFTPAIDTIIQDTTNFSIPGGPGTSINISAPVPPQNINQDVFLLITLTNGPATGSRVVVLTSTQCAPLPVAFGSFRASRTSKTNVTLRWETMTEINNSGFAIQRNLGNNNWQTITFVPSQTTDGNSSSRLTYTYNDLNSFKGISQYRIKQVDLDGKSKLSDIRAVRGDGQSDNTIVYPVPSRDGRVNVVFNQEEGTWNVNLLDMNGRTVRQWKAVTGNTLKIENLRQGVYTLRIQNSATGSVSVEKLVVALQ